MIAAKIDYHVWKKYALPIFIAGLILLILPFIPGIGSTHGTGARSWIVLGGNSFQPAEAIKLGMIIFMAAFLSNMGKQIYDLKHGFLVALGVGLIPIVMVIAQPDIGTTFILFSILIFLLFFH